MRPYFAARPEMNFETHSVHCRNSTIDLPYYALRRRVFDSTAVLLLDTERPHRDQANFDIPSGVQNIVGISEHCEVNWFSAVPPEIDPSPAKRYHQNIWKLEDRLISKGKSDSITFHEIDTEDGQITSTWGEAEFKIGSTIITVDSQVRDLRFSAGVYIIATDEHLFGFDKAGQQLWNKPRDYKLGDFEKPRPSNGNKWILADERSNEDSQYVWAKIFGGRNPQEYEYKLDPQTGHFVEARNGPESWLEA